jgi:hypothetical protein
MGVALLGEASLQGGALASPNPRAAVVRPEPSG